MVDHGRRCNGFWTNVEEREMLPKGCEEDTRLSSIDSEELNSRVARVE
jgi:hypothetical protein